MVQTIITDELIKTMTDKIGYDNLGWFQQYLEEFGELSPVYPIGKPPCVIPHSVHFREGMMVRNDMRSTGLCDNWDAHDFDNNWIELVEKCLGYHEDCYRSFQCENQNGTNKFRKKE